VVQKSPEDEEAFSQPHFLLTWANYWTWVAPSTAEKLQDHGRIDEALSTYFSAGDEEHRFEWCIERAIET